MICTNAWPVTELRNELKPEGAEDTAGGDGCPKLRGLRQVQS